MFGNIGWSYIKDYYCIRNTFLHIYIGSFLCYIYIHIYLNQNIGPGPAVPDSFFFHATQGIVGSDAGLNLEVWAQR